MSALNNRYYLNYIRDLDDTDMIELVDRCSKELRTTFNLAPANIEHVVYNVLTTSNIPKPDCCRFAALTSLVLDELGYSRYYEVYEGYATPPKSRMTSRDLMSDKKMLDSDDPLSNHVWVEFRGTIIESFNGTHAMNRKPTTMLYPYHQSLVD